MPPSAKTLHLLENNFFRNDLSILILSKEPALQQSSIAVVVHSLSLVELLRFVRFFGDRPTDRLGRPCSL